jgi:glycosyltransferase involved in cell wall biosynthesis
VASIRGGCETASGLNSRYRTNPFRRMPKVSIIIATHSRPHLLPRAVESAQSAGTDVEVVVVDDASSDETANVCRDLKDIVYVRSDKNLGTAGARNLGIAASGSPYVGFLDDDDYRLPGSIDRQIEVLENDPSAVLVYGGYKICDQKGNIIDTICGSDWCREGDLFWHLLRTCHLGCLTAVFRKEAVVEVGLLDESYPGVDDWDLWVRLAEHHRFRAVDEPVAVWRSPDESSGQGSSNLTKLYLMGAELLVNKWLKLPRVQKELTQREIAIKKREVLMSISDQILNDMVGTKSLGNKAAKVAGAIRANPSLLRTAYLYKVLALDVMSIMGVGRRG